MNKQVLALLLILSVASCSGDKRLELYNTLIKDCDKIKIYVLVDDEFKLKEETANEDELKTLKDMLTRGIKPEAHRKFKADKRIEILKHDKVVAQLLISSSTNRPFANVVTDDFGFGFGLTYGIGEY